MVEEILQNSKTMVNIVDLRTYDDYTYSHSLNVSVLSVVMGTMLGLKKKQLNDLAVSALVHDIGKVFIDKNIVNKPAKLTAEEFLEMKKHSEKGYQYLKEHSRFSKIILHGVLEHHEQYKGEGYPGGLQGDAICLFGRIICVADVYDALTSDRPYRRAMIPSDAIEYIMGGYETMFDPMIVDVFIKKVAAYPVGTCVALSNGQTGIVIKNNEGFGLRPVIRIIENAVLTDQVIDLMSYDNDNDILNLTIREIVNI
jgi:HD-GYP domain-containing protein (c-di-GMP phosphodiesterase class II)